MLGGHFASRAMVLKARSTLATVWALAEMHGGAEGRMLRDRIRDIERAAHELVEIRLLSQLRRGRDRARRRRRWRPAASSATAAPARRCASGCRRRRRPTRSRRRRSTTIGRWRVVAEDPLLDADAREVVRGVIRSCEALAVAER